MTTELVTAPPADERMGLPSASSFERRVFCPGSGTFEPAIPLEQEESEIAKRGVDIHEALATDDDSELLISDKKVKDKLKGIENEALNQWLAQKQIPVGKVTVIRETRVWIRDRNTLKPIASAKVDFAAIAEEHGMALVVDAKSGFLDSTPAEVNWQLRVQAVAIWHEYNFKINHITAAISQGRGKGKFDPVSYDKESLPWAESMVKFHSLSSADPFAPRVPGDWCRYCRAKEQCREYASFSLMPAIAAHRAVGEPMKKADIIAKVDLLPPESLAWIFSRRNAMENLLEGVKGRLKAMGPQQLEALGLQAVPNAGRRKITDVPAAFHALNERGLITDYEFRELCKLPVGAVEEAIAGRVQTMMMEQQKTSVTLEEATAELNRILSKSITVEEVSPSIKPIKTLKPLKTK